MKAKPTSRLATAVAALAVVAVACGAGSVTQAVGNAAATPAELDSALTQQWEYFDGSVATLDSAYAGRPLVVNFWASWCPSCVAEMSAAFKPVQERFGDSVAFIGFDVQDERSKALELVEETGVLFDLADDPNGDLYAEFGGLGMPFTVFVSADGEILEEHNGPLSEGQLDGKVQEHFPSA